MIDPIFFAPITDDAQNVERGGFVFTARLVHDDANEAPWDGEDGHGPVSGWTRADKAPGELLLSEEWDSRRFYNYAEACRIARRDGWGCEGGRREGETARAYAARAAMADYQRLRAWCNDEWTYVGVVVEVRRNGIKLATDSLWGIESDAGDYLAEVANDCADNALAEAREAIAALADA